MDLKFDNETIAILLYKARRRIALRKAIYNCRCDIDSLSYEEWKKKHIKKGQSEKKGSE